MMFTEGLDESAINWVKQGSELNQKPRSPLTEQLPFSNLPNLHKSNSFLSPKVLPPVKFHSGLLGIQPSTYAEDSGDDKESIDSISVGHYAYCSDTFEEELMDSSDSNLFDQKKEIVNEEEITIKSESTCESAKAVQHRTVRSNLVRGLSKENLKVDVTVNSPSSNVADVYSASSAYGHNKEYSGFTNPRFEELGTPSAPPIMDIGKEESFLGAQEQTNSESLEVSSEVEHNLHGTSYPPIRNISAEGNIQTSSWQNKFVNQVQCYTASAERSWQSFIAYDACFRLCLNAWARNCMEAPEFLRDECMVLRDAFGIQKYLLKPWNHIQGEGKLVSDDEGNCTLKERKDSLKIEVEVKKIRFKPRRQKLQSTYSSPTLFMQAGSEYFQHVTSVLKNRINSLKSTSYPTNHEEAFCCLMQLKNSSEEELEDSISPVFLTPGTGESYAFHPESQGEALFIQVQDISKMNLGQARIAISILISNAHQGEKVRWWPIYLADNGCVGKIQLSINITSSLDKINSAKGGFAVETLIYDLVLEASMRANNFQAKNLQIHGVWKWLLNEFASYYGVTNAYTKLRYLSYITNVATPTKECLELICVLLLPVLKARDGKCLTRQERSILLDCEDQIKNLLAITFQNYKSLDEHSPTGLTDCFGPIPEMASSALTPAVELFCLLHDILSQESQNILTNFFKTAAAKRWRRHLVDTEEFMSSNCDVAEPTTISAAYTKMKTLCLHTCKEIQSDIKIQNQNILPSCIDLPNIAASLYSIQLCQRLRNFLSAFPPSEPAPYVTELLITTADFERDLSSWNISPVHGGVISRDLFHNYIEVWIKDSQHRLVEICRAEKIPFSGMSTDYSTSSFVENMYDQIRDNLNKFTVVVNRWPEYLISIESAVTDVERAILKALEKQYSEALMPLKDGIPKKIEKQMQKLTRRQITVAYTVSNELGIFLNTIKRILDVHHSRVEEILKSAASFLTLANGNENFGERTNAITIMLRTNYKNYKHAIIKILVNNTEANRSTRLKKILEETKEAKSKAEIRESMQALCMQLTDSIQNLHVVFPSKIFIEICRDFWDKMGQIILSFLESRKENRTWYREAGYALGILDDVFASEMQTLQGNSIREEDLDPPSSVVEARSILC